MALGLKPRVEGMPPYHHSLCKNAEVTDFIFLLTGYFQLSNPNHYSACAGDQGLPAMRPSCGGGNEQAAILPHSAGGAWSLSDVTGTESLPLRLEGLVTSS